MALSVFVTRFDMFHSQLLHALYVRDQGEMKVAISNLNNHKSNDSKTNVLNGIERNHEFLDKMLLKAVPVVSLNDLYHYIHVY